MKQNKNAIQCAGIAKRKYCKPELVSVVKKRPKHGGQALQGGFIRAFHENA
ncbi:hypothetical protein V8J88_11780 [Massilia sp. W12]|uniref:hypothetical protein n=1 Tax=Massilia sp. W12 TaxID=3126507 RepID=UPI0030D4EA97